MSTATIKKITIYPIKGCRGYDLNTSGITGMGLAGDREFTILRDQQRAGQKQVPELIHLSAEPMPGSGRLKLGYPGRPDFELDPKLGINADAITVYTMQVPVIDMGDEVANWLSTSFGVPVRLARVQAAVDWLLPLDEFAPVNGKKQSKFVDAAPILLTSLDSLQDLNARLEVAVPMNRFRANIVIEGLAPYQEDDITRFNFPGTSLGRVTVCERCIVTTTDQDTGVRAKEPLRTLSKYRKRKQHYAGGIMFGMYLVPETTGIISVGDPLTLTR